MPRMNFPSVFWSMAFALLILSYTFFSGCEKTSDVSNGNPNGTLVKYTGCKNTTGIAVSDTTPDNLDCIEYSFDNDDGILRLKHINAGFNCCPGKLTADISINSDAIIINEKEQEAGCKCECLFDIDYEIKNLDSWTFRIVVVEPYRSVEEDVLEFDVDLKAQPSGKFCVERNNYPWNMK
ncbi:MAG: hypothetical protein A2X61_05395 [Ignavibacteria bacterium GWB2_35_12]|nr:MAG: hypothetical protein A2X63_09195 [Ignavibacteria bacterium GWA2_35_8]OGU38578.1 MAG: hypothetical protein A2X61_05395 [Ignavibacteria bacterium GWB2_35_12]OGU94256.1 MAG: hypothetical protein A2220_13290 [Ignavibacteria bacterium RIFOXYA2_FULL_35_10]OGV20550.1 MAG: hypothetical protein A2475_03230 [Ignavibacteria bacterium RIFOXYC2_FULL_35_21]